MTKEQTELTKKEEWEEASFEKTPIWDYANDPNASNEFVGKFSGSKHNLGENNSSLHSFNVNGEKIGVWGCSILDSRLENIEIGSLVKIVYNGKKPSAKKGRKDYHDFKIYIKKEVK